MSTTNAVPSQERIERIRTRWARTTPCEVYEKSRHGDICGDCGWPLHCHDIRDLLAALDAQHQEIARHLSATNENVKRGDTVAAIRDLAQVAVSAKGNSEAAERCLAEQTTRAIEAERFPLEMLFLIQERVPETKIVSGLRAAVGVVLDKLSEQGQELARLRALTTWQPIETAPKDGGFFLLHNFNGVIAVGYWLVKTAGSPCWWANGYGAFQPTHWQPLPAAPRAEPTEEQSHAGDVHEG